MENFENGFLKMLKMLESFDVDWETIPNFRENITQNINNSMEQFTIGKSAAEITEIKNQTHIIIDNICNRINIPFEEKLLSEKEFYIYKLLEEKNISPKLKSYERVNGQFFIRYKKYESIDMVSKDIKESMLDLVNKMHDMKIYHGNINKNNIMFNQYEGIRLIDFSNSCWIDEINKDLLINNSYEKICTTNDELLQLEIEMVNNIYMVDQLRSIFNNSEIKDEIKDESENLDDENKSNYKEYKVELYKIEPYKIKQNDNHFHSSDEENIYY